jgi:hemoglobin-like flavoprotein
MKLDARLLREHFESLRPHADGMVARFYEILFARHPEIRPMFAKTDMEAQRKKFIETLDRIVQHLEQPATVLSDLLVLGNSHVDYGVRPEQYAAVCDCLVEAMKEASGPRWTPTLEKAWRDAYAAVAEIMKKGNVLRRK